jgi:hypothetical protein
MKTKIFAATLILAAQFCNAQIGAKAQSGKLQGIWTNNEFGFQMMLMLNADGSGEFDGESIKYTSQGDKLVVTQSGTSNTYAYVLKGNELTLSGGDLEKAITFTRTGGQTSSSQSQAQSMQSQHQASSSSNTSANTNIPKELLGSWTGYGETVEFKADGKSIIRGQSVPFTVSGNNLTLQTAQGNIMMAFSVNGNSLNMIANGQNFTYTRAGGGSASPTTNVGGKNLDMSLVGKWCYMKVSSSYSGGSSTEECITLKEDGTYSYYYESSRSVNTSDLSGGTASQDSDSGTWWVEGNQIFYNSRTQGQGSYQLEKRNYPKTGDPMIVLNGRTFVTAYNRPGW